MHCFKIAFCFQKHTKTVFIKHLKIGILESSLYMFIKNRPISTGQRHLHIVVQCFITDWGDQMRK